MTVKLLPMMRLTGGRLSNEPPSVSLSVVVMFLCLIVCCGFVHSGPGPVPRLDGLNIPFGRVLEGMGVVGAVTAVSPL